MDLQRDDCIQNKSFSELNIPEAQEHMKVKWSIKTFNI